MNSKQNNNSYDNQEKTPVTVEKKSKTETTDMTRIRKSTDKIHSENASISGGIQPDTSAVKKKKKKRYGNSSLSAGMKTVIYIGVVIVLAVILSLFIIFAANDVFAFSKPDKEVTVTLGEFPDVSAISDLLYDNGIISFPGIFKLYAKVKNKENLNFTPGTYTVNTKMDYSALLSSFVPSAAAREQISITIPEGYCVDEIIDLFLSKGIGTRDGFIDVINNSEFDYWFLKDLKISENRIYRLEGYLYPDTYYFWSDSSEYTAIKKLLDNFKKKVKKSWLVRCEELGITFDEMLTLASMIQEEARFAVDYTTVSSVFYNRMKSAEFAGLLQSDATIQYYYRHVYGVKKSPFTDEDRKAITFYNSYIYKGMPPSPLSTPSVEAMNCAMYPIETKYYYFVSDNDGFCIFAETFEEHQANVEAVANGKKAQEETTLDEVSE